MRAGVGAVVLGCFAVAGVCSCGPGRLDDADAGNDSGPASQSSFTVDWSQSTPGQGVRLACSSGGDAIAYYVQVPASQTRRYHAGAWADAVALPVLADQVQATGMSSDGVGTFVWAASSPSVPMADDLYADQLAPDDRWSGPSVIGDGGIGWWQEPTPPRPVVGVDASGSAFAIWSRIDEWTNQPRVWPSAVWASHAAPNGAWVNEGSIDKPGAASSSRPSLLARGRSDTIAAWEWTDGNRAQVLVARRTESVWSAPSVVEDAAAKDMRFSLEDGPTLAGGRTGEMVVVYPRVSETPTASTVALVSRHSSDGVSWSDAEVLTPSAAAGFQLAQDGAGGAVVFWNAPASASAATMRVLSGGEWSAPLTVMTSPASRALVAQHPDGRIVFFYAEGDGISPSTLELRRYTQAGGWQAVETVDQNAERVSDLCFAGDHLVAAWQRSGTVGVVGAFP